MPRSAATLDAAGSAGLAAFQRDEAGSATIEMLLWTPFLLFFLIGVVDIARAYHVQGSMWDVARDTARQYATGFLTTEDGVRQYARNNLPLLHGAAAATDAGAGTTRNGAYTVTLVDDDGDTTDLFAVGIAVPVERVSIFGRLPAAILPNLSARVVMKLEPGRNDLTARSADAGS